MESGLRIEPVRGRSQAERPAGLATLWEASGKPGSDPRAWLAEVAVAVVDAEGRAAGASTVRPQRIPFVGGRELWAYQAVLAPHVPLDWFMPMLGATFDLLAAEFALAGEGPAGVFLSLRSRELIERHRQFVWPDPAFMYVGYMPDGGQARLRYFEGGTI